MSVLWGVLAVLVLLAPGCDGETTATTGGPEGSAPTGGPAVTSETTGGGSNEPIRLGQLVSMTGPSAAPAANIVRAADLEVDYLNSQGGVAGRMIELIVEDDQSEVGAAVAGAQQLIEQDRVDAYVGPFPQFVEAAAREVAEKAGIPNIMYMPPTLKSLADTSFQWTFLCTAGPNALADALQKLLVAEGYQRVVAIADDLPIHQETLELLQESPGLGSIEFTAISAGWTLEETDVDSIVAMIAAQVEQVGADAVMVLSNPIHAPGIQKGLRAQGITQPVIGSPAATSPAMFVRGPQDAEGMVVIGPGIVNPAALPADYPGKQEMAAFADRYRARFNEPADFYAGFAHDAIHLMVNAMRAAGDPSNRAQVRDAIQATRNWQGVQGIFSYSEDDHVGIHGGLAQWTIRGGQFEFVRDLNAGKVGR